jgi:hypothetical protein
MELIRSAQPLDQFVRDLLVRELPTAEALFRQTDGPRWDSPPKIGFAPDSPLEGAVRCELVSAGGPPPPIKGQFHRRSDEFLESIKKGVETPAENKNNFTQF